MPAGGMNKAANEISIAPNMHTALNICSKISLFTLNPYIFVLVSVCVSFIYIVKNRQKFNIEMNLFTNLSILNNLPVPNTH